MTMTDDRPMRSRDDWDRDVLAVLADGEWHIGTRMMAAISGRTTSNPEPVMVALRRLRAMGYAEWDTDPAITRRARWRITERGREVLG